MIHFRCFSVILVGTSLLSACEKINETNIAEYKALCSEYGHVQNSSQFSKCIKRQNIIHWRSAPRYELEEHYDNE